MTSQLKQHLHSKNQRLTKSKQLILDLLSSNPPLDASQIYQKVSQLSSTNLATIYRNLASLSALGLIQSLQLSGMAPKYELKDDNHHHHLVCNACGKIEEFHLPEETNFTQIKPSSGFSIEHHVLEFFGRCKTCQNPAQNL